MKFLTAIFLTACSQTGPITKYGHYFNEFNEDLRVLGYRTLDFSNIILIEENVDDARAACENTGIKFHGEMAVIKISTRFKNEQPYAQKLILYHEIGHCYLGLLHSFEKTKWLMAPGDILGRFSKQEIEDDSTRRSYVRDMVEYSIYPQSIFQ